MVLVCGRQDLSAQAAGEHVDNFSVVEDVLVGVLELEKLQHQLLLLLRHLRHLDELNHLAHELLEALRAA